MVDIEGGGVTVRSDVSKEREREKEGKGGDEEGGATGIRGRDGGAVKVDKEAQEGIG